MRKGVKALLGSAIAVSVASCGGDGIGTGGAGSLYNLDIKLDTALITSKTAEMVTAGSGGSGQSVVVIPADTISGKVSLVYTGSSQQPLKGAISSAEICVMDRCHPLNISGFLHPNAEPVSFNVTTNAHKFGLPWIAVNPFEDRVVSTSTVSVSLTGANQQVNLNSVYYNSLKTELLSQQPVARGSVLLTSSGEAEAVETVEINSGRAVLPKGITLTNRILENSVRVVTSDGAECSDDGSGSLTGGCSGSVDYATGEIRVNGGASVATVRYRITGNYVCYDDGRGLLEGDCSGNIDYTAGRLSYRFNYRFTAIPQTVNISYLRPSSGDTVYFTLPPDAVEGIYTYRVYGRDVNIYQNGIKICGLNSPTAVCSVQKERNIVKVRFNGEGVPDTTLEYTVDTKMDFNPSIDATVYGGKYAGSSTPSVQGQLKVKVKLEDGSELEGKAPITFRVVP